MSYDAMIRIFQCVEEIMSGATTYNTDVSMYDGFTMFKVKATNRVITSMSGNRANVEYDYFPETLKKEFLEKYRFCQFLDWPSFSTRQQGGKNSGFYILFSDRKEAMRFKLEYAEYF